MTTAGMCRHRLRRDFSGACVAAGLVAAALTVGLGAAGADGPSGPPQSSGPEDRLWFSRRVADDAGSADAPLLVGIGIHVEPLGARPSTIVAMGDGPSAAPTAQPDRPGPAGTLPNYNDNAFFGRHADDLRLLADMAERHGGRLTIQVQTPFTRTAAERGETVLADLERRGHEIALHFHEDAHLGRGSERLLRETWTAVMKEEINIIGRCGVRRVRYWSGGNLYPGLLDAASAAGLTVMGDYKNPRVQRSDDRLMTVHPWRPAGGPAEGSLDAFACHDVRGKIIYLPDGIYPSADYGSLKRGRGPEGDVAYFNLMTEGLERSLRASRKDRVNVFHVTVHPGEFRGPPRLPYAVVEKWLTETIDPLVKAGKVRWATFSQMADAYEAWERANPGVEPRGTSTAAATVPSTD